MAPAVVPSVPETAGQPPVSSAAHDAESAVSVPQNPTPPEGVSAHNAAAPATTQPSPTSSTSAGGGGSSSSASGNTEGSTIKITVRTMHNDHTTYTLEVANNVRP